MLNRRKIIIYSLIVFSFLSFSLLVKAKVATVDLVEVDQGWTKEEIGLDDDKIYTILEETYLDEKLELENLVEKNDFTSLEDLEEGDSFNLENYRLELEDIEGEVLGEENQDLSDSSYRVATREEFEEAVESIKISNQDDHTLIFTSDRIKLDNFKGIKEKKIVFKSEANRNYQVGFIDGSNEKLELVGSIVFENIIPSSYNSTGEFFIITNIYGQGNPIEFGEEYSSNKPINVFGGSYGKDLKGDTSIVIRNGSFSSVVGGSRDFYTSKSGELGRHVTLDGSTSIKIYGGRFYDTGFSISPEGLAAGIYGGGIGSDTTGNTNIKIDMEGQTNNKRINKYIVGGGIGWINSDMSQLHTGQVKGNTNMIIDNSNIQGHVYGGGYHSLNNYSSIHDFRILDNRDEIGKVGGSSSLNFNSEKNSVELNAGSHYSTTGNVNMTLGPRAKISIQNTYGNGLSDVIRGQLKITVEDGIISNLNTTGQVVADHNLGSKILNENGLDNAVEVKIKSGKIDFIEATGNMYKNNPESRAHIRGNILVEVLGGSVNQIYGYNSKSAVVEGDITIKIKDGSLTGVQSIIGYEHEPAVGKVNLVFENKDKRTNPYRSIWTVRNLSNIIVEKDSHVTLRTYGGDKSPMVRVENMIIKEGASLGLYKLDDGKIEIQGDLILDGGSLRLKKREKDQDHLHVGGQVRGKGYLLVTDRDNFMITPATPVEGQPYIIAENSNPAATIYSLKNEDPDIHLARSSNVVNPLIGGSSPDYDIYYIAAGSQYSIEAWAEEGGEISPAGTSQVPGGGSQSYIIVPNPGYEILDIKVDGISQGPISSYKFEDLAANHSIVAYFNKIKLKEVGPKTKGRSSSKARTPKEIKLDIGDLFNMENHEKYIYGYTDNRVKPNKNITRGEVTAIFYRLLKDDARKHYETIESDFIDVSEKNWYMKDLATMNKIGIIEGYPDKTFRGNQPIRRSEFAVIVSKFESEAYQEKADLFVDIEKHWAREYINRAGKKGWIKGYPDGSFRPEAYITRAEAVSLINAVLNRGKIEKFNDTMKLWPDNKIGDWHYEAIQESSNSHSYRRNDLGEEVWIENLY